MTAADTILAPANMRRLAVIIGTPHVATVWLSFTGAAVAGQGIALRPGNLPLILSGDPLVGALLEEIHAISDGAAEAIGIVDVLR